MATAKSAKKKGVATFLSELARATVYKRNQGRFTRQLTWAGAFLIVAFGVWALHSGPLNGRDPMIEAGVPLGLLVAGGWILFRVVNYPRFADFLISVEAEMDKVTWSSHSELYRATVVVIMTMFFLGALLFLYDQFWVWFFHLIGFLEIGT